MYGCSSPVDVNKQGNYGSSFITAISEQFLKGIAEFLLSLLPPTSDASTVGVEPVIQAASALIDIYSDEDTPYDVNFRQGGYLEQLSSSIDGVKKAVKSIDRKKEGGRELRRRGEEVKENLVAFVGYRRSLRL